jgi:hypothetical protein
LKKNRATLKDYFKKGAIPTDANFADLIDSMLNQEEDNVNKLPNDPLRITATGADEALLNFYRLEQGQEKLSWQFKQKPGGKPGLSIGDETTPRLFIESASGRVGLGTTAPTQTLDVRGRINVENGVIQRSGTPITNTSDLGLYSQVDRSWIRIVSTNGPIRFFADGGIGTNMELSIEKGGLSVTGALSFGSQTRQMINLWSTGYGIGVQGYTQYFRTDKNFAWYKGGAHNDNELNPGGGGVQMALNDGNLGIGIAIPKAKLQVVGGAIMPDAGNSEAAGILFPPDPGGGSSDRAWMRYYVRSASAPEAMTLELGTSNDTDDHIALMPSGNVGIGTNSPSTKLEVVGVVNFHDGNGSAARNGNMASGSLTIGSVNKNYGGGSNWNANTAGLLLEAQANTEIAVHDSGTRLTSLMFYEGDANNRLTIGRDMGWGPLSNLVLNGTVGIGSLQLKGFTTADADEWPNVTWYRDTNANWDEGLIKHGTSRGKFGRAGFGIHMHQSREFGFFSTGWDPLFAVQGATGNTYVKGYLETKQVYFSAYLDSNARSGNVNPLPMQVASQNIGNCYDTNSSKFTAPVKGLYLFTMTGHRVEGSEWLHWYLMVNGGFANSGGTNGSEPSERCIMSWYAGNLNASRTMLVPLNAGDTVWIQQAGNGRCDNFRSGLEGTLLSANL